MGALITGLLSFFTKPVADLVGGYTARKQVAAEMAADVAKAENNVKIAEAEARAERARNREQNDTDYDLTVLHNRENSTTDDIIIYVFLGIFIAHFIPALQPYMHAGWVAMGYNGVPWWFELVLVGICVSTLGLMRMFRSWRSLRGS